MLTLGDYAKYTLIFRLTCSGGSAILALALAALRHRLPEVGFLYVFMDGIISVVIIPVIFPAGWRMVFFHLLASSVFLAFVWQVLIHGRV